MTTIYRALPILVLSLGVVLGLTSPPAAQSMNMGSTSGGMSMMEDVDTSKIPRVPPVAGYAEGELIYFIHTEVSDPEIGLVMTDMMGSPVPVVPELADAPASMLARVWAFTNGVQPDGPRGPLDFQPDIFDHPVGTDGYRPLRRLILVTWGDGSEPRLLTSAADLDDAIANGELAVENTAVVVNAPLLTWPGGKR